MYSKDILLVSSNPIIQYTYSNHSLDNILKESLIFCSLSKVRSFVHYRKFDLLFIIESLIFCSLSKVRSFVHYRKLEILFIIES